MSETTVARVKSERMRTLACSTFALLFLGLIYAFSMFAAPMSAAFELEKGAIGLTFNIMMIAFCIGAVVGSQVERRIGVKGAIVIAAVLFFAGFAGTGLLAKGSIAVVYLCYGVLGGLGVGMGYNTIVSTTNLWFPDKVGFSSGVLMMGFGLGSLILGTLSVNLVPLFGLGTVFVGVGAAGGVVAVAAAFMLRRPPENIVALMAPEQAVGAAASGGATDERFLLKTPILYLFWIWAVIVVATGLATIGNCAANAQLVGLDAAFATLLVGLVSTCNGLARVVVGMIYDRTNVKVTMFVDGAVAAVACACIIGAFATGTPALYIAGALCCGFAYGGEPVVASAFARQRYGSAKYPLNLSIINTSIIYGSLLSMAAQAAAGGADSPLAVFTILGVLSVVALVDVLPFSKKWNADLRANGAGAAALPAKDA
ncbi:MFS transporter [Gordonibacter massiliensis (ex Traore et al. 2017)]|uniref:MFS transporter n=1 Tax=Gordonibacter massiliensis (ex Traore et al. 2017) TaxID=1841863 RepID=UPI001C8BD311|nr:MFS transporter [Gordonibacter massiliensis (ex Traore et al. 2017)]MBX9032838.1 OFA family MFS transporter [Gordonibacter massiliensis (ex Traore et al. 2017)]